MADHSVKDALSFDVMEYLIISFNLTFDHTLDESYTFLKTCTVFA